MTIVDTTVMLGAAGVYQFQLQLSDSEGQTIADTMTISAGRPVVSSVENAIVERDGQVAFEAEDYEAILPGREDWLSSNWIQGVGSDACANVFVQGGPDSGLRDREAEDSPALEFPIRFRRGGTFNVWVRMRGEDSGSDSLHVGSELPVTGLNGIRQNDSSDWLWIGEVPGSGPAQVVARGGETKIFRVWPREDGVDIDRIVLALEPNTNPDDVVSIKRGATRPGSWRNITAGAGPDQAVQVGERFTLDELGSTGPITQYEGLISAGPSNTALNNRATLTRTYANPGTYEIDLRVKNAAGDFHVDVTTITVLPEQATVAFATLDRRSPSWPNGFRHRWYDGGS